MHTSLRQHRVNTFSLVWCGLGLMFNYSSVAHRMVSPGSPVSWKTKKYDVISRSSTEAEYREMADTLSELLWFREILPEMGIICNALIVLHSVSFSAINLAANPIHHVRTNIVISFVTKSFEVQMLQNMYRLNLNLQTSWQKLWVVVSLRRFY